MDGSIVSLTNQEISRFLADLGCAMLDLQERAYKDSDWPTLALVQEILSMMGSASSSPVGIIISPQQLEQFSRLSGLLGDLVVIHPEIGMLRKKAKSIHDFLSIGQSPQRNMDFIRRLFGMHRFLDGVSGTESFGSLSFERDDVKYGLGIGLNDGSMLDFFMRLQERNGENTEEFLGKFFEEDTQELISAVHEGQASLEAFMQSQLVLRFDPVMSRKRFFPHESLQAKFNRLGTEPVVQNVQIDMVAGKNYDIARKRARNMGIKTLRGFAMLFDVGELAEDNVIENVEQAKGESQKCISLADEVLSRMHGHVAAHWQSRLSSVFHGTGVIEDRIYDEKRFFGTDAEHKEWENIDFSKEDDRDMPQPVSGHTYVVRPGDRLYGLARQAYGSSADYRLLLRQNPQITHPELLPVGMRIFFPDIKSDGSDVTDNQSRTSQARIVGDELILGDRHIGPLSILSHDQISQLRELLDDIPPVRLYGTVAMPLPQGVVVSCDNRALIISNEQNEMKCVDLWPGEDAPIHRWGEVIASKIRGDVEVAENIRLPLADIPGQTHRREWMATALRRLIDDRTLYPIRIVLHTTTKTVDVVDSLGKMILRLETQDFEAIRLQPWRRLRDYVAPPIVQMNMLTQLWISDLLQDGAEIVVSPLSHINEYALTQTSGKADFLVPMGTPVYAMSAGKIRTCTYDGDNGYTVTIDHHGGLVIAYSALAAVCVHPGQVVNAETMIARSGMGERDGVQEPMLRLEMKGPGDGEYLDYFDVVCNLWTEGTLVDCVMGV